MNLVLKPARKSINLSTAIQIFAVLMVLTVLFWFIHRGNTDKRDWLLAYRPAVYALFSGQNPYKAVEFYNPPWALIALIPLALLPSNVGSAALSAISFVAFIFVLRKLNSSRLATFVYLINPSLLVHYTFNPNLDWMIALSLVMPARIGLFFALIKPQLGIGLAVYWFIEAWRQGKLRQVISVFAPVIVASVLSVLIYGPFWSSASRFVTDDLPWNLSFWPYSIPIALALLVHGIRNHKRGFALLSAPFFSPYTPAYVWQTGLLGLLPQYELELIAVVIGMWIVVIGTRFGFPL